MGYAAGLTAGRPPAPETTQNTSAPRTTRAPRSLVCARRASAPGQTSANECDCEALSGWAGLMERQLAECEAGSRRIREPWPSELPTAEDPDAWVEAIEGAFETCDVPAALERIDCLEYPCVAALRGNSDDSDEDAEATAEAIRAQLTHCEPLRNEFSLSEAHEDAIQVHSVEIPCDDGSTEHAQMVLALHPLGPAWSEFSKEDQDIDAILRWYYRRTDDLIGSWKCATDQSPL